MANFDEQFLEIKQASACKKLLLHACCAPCSTYCLTQVLDTFDVTLFYANDNITDFAEWQKRLDNLQKLVDIVNSGQFEVVPKFPLKLVVQNFDCNRFFQAAQGLENASEGGARCEKCFALRLDDAKSYASQNGFDFFATTLSVSPHKNAQLLNNIGVSLQTESLLWLPTDFKKRNGFNESVRLSNKYQLYRQCYCGCVFSNWTLAPTNNF